jgi:hypothetical protein
VHPALRKIIGSFLAALFGCAVGVLSMLISTVALDSQHSLREPLISALASRFALIAVWVLPAWLLILLPLYTFLPRTSSLWRTPICTLLGAISGAVIILAYLIVGGGLVAVVALWFFWAEAALIGAATCFFGAVTADYFHGTRTV